MGISFFLDSMFFKYDFTINHFKISTNITANGNGNEPKEIQNQRLYRNVNIAALSSKN